MNRFTTLAVALWIGLLGISAHGAENANLTATVKYYAAEIKQSLDAERWNVQETPTTIAIESKFKVEIRRLVSPALGADPVLEIYRIELRFQPLISQEDYVKLSKERMDRLVMLHQGTRSKMEWSHAHKFLKENPLPRYRVTDRVGIDYSVYLHTSDSVSTLIVPRERHVEVKSVETILDHILWPLAQ